MVQSDRRDWSYVARGTTVTTRRWLHVGNRSGCEGNFLAVSNIRTECRYWQAIHPFGASGYGEVRPLSDPQRQCKTAARGRRCWHRRVCPQNVYRLPRFYLSSLVVYCHRKNACGYRNDPPPRTILTIFTGSSDFSRSTSTSGCATVPGLIYEPFTDTTTTSMSSPPAFMGSVTIPRDRKLPRCAAALIPGPAPFCLL